MHQIEYKAAKLEAQKLQMANESTRVYEDYLNAMDKTKIQYKVLNTDGSTTYKDITNYSSFLDAGYALNYNGIIYDGSSVLSTPLGYIVREGNKYKKLDGSGYVETKNITQSAISSGKYPSDITTTGVYYTDGTTYIITANFTKTATNLDFAQLCSDAYGAKSTPTGNDVDTIITNLINSGNVTIVTKRDDGTFASGTDDDLYQYETSVSTNTGLQEVTDELNLKKAEAKYEAQMKQIDLKDRKFDTDLAALDTERNAIKSEIDTLKSVAKENVERTFKLFS